MDKKAEMITEFIFMLAWLLKYALFLWKNKWVTESELTLWICISYPHQLFGSAIAQGTKTSFSTIHLNRGEGEKMTSPFYVVCLSISLSLSTYPSLTSPLYLFCVVRMSDGIRFLPPSPLRLQRDPKSVTSDWRERREDPCSSFPSE